MICVAVCPVDCFCEGDNMLLIHPERIDCGVCEPECPPDAIVPGSGPRAGKWLKLNAGFAVKWPDMTAMSAPSADASKGVKGGYEKIPFPGTGQGRAGLKLMGAALVALAFAAALAAGCASFDGRGLSPGVSTAQEIERVMGAPAERRQVGSETWLYFSRQPYGRRIYVARIGADGRLIGLEQRLTEENIARLQQGKTTADEVLQLLGPPWMTNRFPRMQREVWSYRTEGVPYPKVLYLQFSPDRVVREVYHMDDPEVIPRNDGGAEPASFRR